MIDIADLSPESRELLAVFVEMARDEVAGRQWDDVGPTLRSCWERMHVPGAPAWEDISDHVRAACCD